MHYVYVICTDVSEIAGDLDLPSDSRVVVQERGEGGIVEKAEGQLVRPQSGE